MVLRIMYTIFLASMIALFVGLGIQAFYPEPKMPDYPIELESPRIVTPESTETIAKHQAIIDKYEKERKEYREKISVYNRNASIISLIAAILIMTLSLLLWHRIKMISNGILLGGVFILFYSIMRGLYGDSDIFRFSIVTIGLILALILGYIIFIKPSTKISSEET